MDELGEALRALLDRRGISQSALAREAGVSQATVSRAISGTRIRAGRARAQLFNYIHSEVPGPQHAIDAMREIWDGTTAHEEALAVLIRASGGLWPRLAAEVRTDGTDS